LLKPNIWPNFLTVAWAHTFECNKATTCRINATWFSKWRWLCCTQTGSWGQRGMDSQRKDVKTCSTTEDYCFSWVKGASPAMQHGL